MSGPPHLTYVWITLAVFARQLCLPFPALLLLIGAGALAGHGQLNLGLVIVSGVVGCLGGDGVWFWLGRRWGTRVVRILCRLTSDPRGNSQRAHRMFDRLGLPLLSVAKFIPVLDGITPPLAGAERASVSAFLAFDGLGSLLWTTAYVTGGWIFKDQLGEAIATVENFGTILGAVIGIPLFAYISWRAFTIVRMMMYLRQHRLSAYALDRRLKSGERIAILDLLNFEDCEDLQEGIPGAARIDPARLRATPKVALPDDLSVVVYCSSSKQIISARVVVAMRNRGAKNVWILQDGLEGWRRAGFPLTKDLLTAQELAGKMGIELPEPVFRRSGLETAEQMIKMSDTPVALR